MPEIPKPLKKDRPGIKRRKLIKKQDREIQLAIGGEGICQNCGKWRELTGHHLIPRRYQEHRHDLQNLFRTCVPCHLDIHSLSREKFAKKYPLSPLCSQ